MRNVFKSSTGKNPLWARAEYSPGALCPLESTKRSLSSLSGSLGSMSISSKYKKVNTSAEEREPPGCPALAL